MALKDDLALVIDLSIPMIHASYAEHFGNIVEEDEVRERVLEQLILLGPRLKAPKKVKKTGPRITNMSKVGEEARKHYRLGEVTPSNGIRFQGIDVLTLPAKITTLRFDRENRVVKGWGPDAWQPSRIPGLDPEDIPCPITAAILNAAASGLEKNFMREAPDEILSRIPRNKKERRERTRYLVLSTTMKGHTLSVQGTREGKPSDRYVPIEPWYSSLHALDKSASTWRFGLYDAQGPGMHGEVAAITDGVILVAGFVE